MNPVAKLNVAQLWYTENRAKRLSKCTRSHLSHRKANYCNKKNKKTKLRLISAIFFFPNGLLAPILTRRRTSSFKCFQRLTRSEFSNEIKKMVMMS